MILFLSATGMESLAVVSFLKILNLQNNSFHGSIPQELGNLFRVQEFHLNNNSIQGEIPVNLTRCLQLKIIDLSKNNLVGKIPEELGSWRMLEEIQISSNNLSGKIPPSIGNLSLLTFFSAALNNFEGNIPDELGRLTRLTYLALGVNNLSEYGMGGNASKEGDLYSYGILVLEMFTGKRPTDKMFDESLNLHYFVKNALPTKLLQIMDKTLFSREMEATTSGEDNGEI